MSIFGKLFNRKKSEKNDKVQSRNLSSISHDDEMANEIEKQIKNHLSKLKSYSELHGKIAKILSKPELILYTKKIIVKGIKESLATDSHIYKGKQLDTTYLSISTIPVKDFVEARHYFDGGYLEHMSLIINDESNYRSGNVDIAHWIFCNGALHLTFLPATSKTGMPVVLAGDLMTDYEKSKWKS